MSTRITCSPPDSEHDQLAEAQALLDHLAGAGFTARALGGVAVALRCPHARPPGPLARAWSDLDLVVDRKSTGGLAVAFAQAGYEGETRFNALHGHARLMFARPGGMHVDVFVEDFVMCHRLALGPRLRLHERTLPLADLLLTKLQVAELNAKDVTDAAALLADHELADDETGINVAYVNALLARDWGWWRTVTENLGRMRERVPELPLDAGAGAQVHDRLSELLDQVERAPKSVRWRIRARAGDRVPWRDEPEESH